MAMILALPALLPTGCGYNNIPTDEEQTKARWSEVLNQYRRPADLIRKGFAKPESGVPEAVTSARAARRPTYRSTQEDQPT